MKSVRENGTLRIQTINNEPSKTQQQFAEECDINTIMKKYSQTGQNPHPNLKLGVYADLTKIPSYEESLKITLKAQSAFMSLDAKIRSRFSNDPHKLIEFLKDSNNDKEAQELGLKIKPIEKQPDNPDIQNPQDTKPKP